MSSKAHYTYNGAPISKAEASRILGFQWGMGMSQAINAFESRAKTYLKANKSASYYTDGTSGVCYLRNGR